MAILPDVKWRLLMFFDYISLIMSDVKHLFMCWCWCWCFHVNIYWPSVCFLWRSVSLGLLRPALFSGLGFFLLLLLVCFSVVWAVCIFWPLTSCWSHFLQIFSPSLEVIFPFCLWFPLLCKILSVITSHLFIFYFYFDHFGRLTYEDTGTVNVKERFAHVLFEEFYGVVPHV